MTNENVLKIGDTVILNGKYKDVYQNKGAIGVIDDIDSLRIIVKFYDCYQNCKEYMLDLYNV